MMSIVKPLSATVMVLALCAGITAVAYARWTDGIADGDRALADGQYDRALQAYRSAEARFDRLAAARQLFAADYNRIVGNQLWTLYRLGRYDETIDKAERSPEGAAPHLWSGLAFFQKGRAEEKPEPRLGWFSRAEEELRRAVEAAPNDWDTKYDFELVTRVAAELRKQPKTPPNQVMQLLRPQPKLGNKPARRVG
jgi:tetratricopeptide (TPR) repeat protein